MRRQDSSILAKSFLCVFMDWDGVKVFVIYSPSVQKYWPFLCACVDLQNFRPQDCQGARGAKTKWSHRKSLQLERKTRGWCETHTVIQFLPSMSNISALAWVMTSTWQVETLTGTKTNGWWRLQTVNDLSRLYLVATTRFNMCRLDSTKIIL